MSPEWFVPLAALIGAVLAFAGGLVGHLFTAKKNRADAQSDLIDQIQEERDRLDRKLEAAETRHSKDINQLNIRITGFYADKSASRGYINMLRAREAELMAHIMLGNPPPPPGASPEPPDGYVP
ncbi:hypothetical protein [Glutamicibacter ardleyensis]|uniref:DUF1043 family protein n=1 Tax=Glutamicibacter ardleyensis TaxID=225894 RepID=A0ABQ2DEU9_9MICC|nr:hypothetical protein [Glutamicibacter ardleyensis]GGJ55610.1 hypothetical protein GCM10007173_12970 [Glutamicibacter ardleyensis]